MYPAQIQCPVCGGLVRLGPVHVGLVKFQAGYECGCGFRMSWGRKFQWPSEVLDELAEARGRDALARRLC